MNFPSVITIKAEEIKSGDDEQSKKDCIYISAALSNGQILHFISDFFDEKLEEIYDIKEDFIYIYNRLISDSVLKKEEKNNKIYIDEKEFLLFRPQVFMKIFIENCNEKDDISAITKEISNIKISKNNENHDEMFC